MTRDNSLSKLLKLYLYVKLPLSSKTMRFIDDFVGREPFYLKNGEIKYRRRQLP